MDSVCDLGVTGLATMGANLARNAARRGFAVAVHNRTRAKADALVAGFGHEGRLVATGDARELVRALAAPRVILIMVKAGPPVDDVIAEFAPHLERGDVLADGGNSLFSDTERRARELAPRGIRYLGVGVSGGEEGALDGPSLMPGGDPEAYERVRPIFEKMAASVDGTPCCTYLGPGGAGHYVKMVHNGIEYALMQAIAEAYDIMQTVYDLSAGRIGEAFADWNRGDLDSYLVQSASVVLRKRDPDGEALIDRIADEAEQKGTGRWTVQQALELGAPSGTTAEAVFARAVSARKAERVAASRVLGRPALATLRPSDVALEAIRDALYASAIVAYAQGFGQLAAASAHFDWKLDLGAIATIWRGGCIVRAKLLEGIKNAYESATPPTELLLVPTFATALARCDEAWRATVALALAHGVPVPASASALTYFDGVRRERSPANLLQGLRDYFGSHTYRRTDRPGSFHVRWAQDGVEVRAADE